MSKFDELIESCIKDMSRYNYLKRGSLDNYRSWLKAVNMWNNGNSVKWIESAMECKKPLEDVEKAYKEFEKNNGKDFTDKKGKKRSVGDDHLASYLKFAKWMIGQYHASMWLSIDKSLELEFCKLIAKHALFCTREIASAVRNGTIGCRGHKESETYSWFDCKYKRRKKGDCKKGQDVGGVTLDDNTKANLAIKGAVKESLPLPRSIKFTDYEACHIWDGTCYDENYHTSVFNLVLVPRPIAGLTDYSVAVKKMLQYESACRFGVFPKKNDPPEKPQNYDKITIWRQQEEHDKAKNIFKGV